MVEKEKNLFIKLKKLKEEDYKEYIKIRNKIIEQSLNLVLSRVYHISGSQDEDLIQAGNEALITAINKFDIEKGNEFSTYAVYWIDRAIHKEILKNNNWVSIPIHKYEDIKSAIKKLSKENQEPTVEELSARTGIKISEVIQILNSLPHPISLNATPDESDSELYETIDNGMQPIEEFIEQKMFKQDIIELLKKTLKKQQFEIITLRYGLIDGIPKTLEQIARIHKITRQRVRQIEKKALEKLENCTELNVFFIYLDDPDTYIKTK